MNDELKMTFDPMTIEHLGVRMYSTLPPVLAELIANGYDAGADNVRIILKDDGGKKEIVVKDDGNGMTFDEINKKFLRIGRNRREEDGDPVSTKGRKAMGKKGLGKLAFFGIAHEIEITTHKESKENQFLMKWEDIKNCSQAEYKPQILKKDEACVTGEHGTTVILRSIQRESDFSPDDLANSLSKIFIVDPGFNITVQHNGGEPIPLDNEKKYAGLDKQVEWNIPADAHLDYVYPRKDGIVGKLIATKKPIPPKTNMRGVTLFSRKKLVNLPEYFSDSTSSHFFSYLTGWLAVDFIDELSYDVIATNRQSLNWGDPEMKDLRAYLRALLNWLEQDWRDKRAAARQEELAQKTGINVPVWFSKLPEDIKRLAEPVLQAIVKESELPEETMNAAAKSFHEIVPEFPKYHWRYLHPEIQKISKQYYENQDYYTAFLEAMKLYINAVKAKSGSCIPDATNMMENVFKPADPTLSVTESYKKPDGTGFDPQTIENIKMGQRSLSVGVVQGGRNVVSHETVVDLRSSGLFREEDCLDALSLLSHLFWRLDNSTKLK